MAVPLPATPAPLEAPLPSPAGVQAPLRPPATDSQTYISGSASGAVLDYPLVGDFAWYQELRLPARIRSSYEATLGRTLVGTPQADIRVSETIPRAVAVDVGTRVAYPTILRPAQPIAQLRVIEDAGGLPVVEQRLQYESRLAALQRMFPDSVYVTAQQVTGSADPTMTAREAIQWLFDAWADQFPDFRAKPVPEMILFVRDDDGRYTQTLTTDRLRLRQTPDRRRSIAQLLEDLRAAFPGYAVLVDSDDDVVLRPPPWAVPRDPVADPAIWLGPTGFSSGATNFRAADRLDISSTPWEIDPAYDQSRVWCEGDLMVAVLGSGEVADPGPITGATPFRLELRPNVPQTVLDRVVVRGIFARTVVLALVRYEIEWQRPGSTGGTIAITPDIDLDTIIAGDTWTLMLAHAVRADAHGEGDSQAPVVTVRPADVQVPMPQATLDASTVVNAQTVRHSEVDFVDDDDLLAPLYLRAGPTDYEPAGANRTTSGTVNEFVDEEGDPLITGGMVVIEWLYELRISASSSSPVDEACARSGTFGGGDCITFGGTFTLTPGQSHAEQVRLSGEFAVTSGPLATIRWTYEQLPDGRQGLVAEMFNLTSRTPNVTVARPWFGHVVSWTTTGSVWRETGVQYNVTYDQDDSSDALASQALFGVREGPPIDINFFGVMPEEMLAMAQGIVQYNVRPRVRYRGLRLTEHAEVTPDDLNYAARLPFTSRSMILEAYAYSDERSIDTALAQRDIDLQALSATSLEGDGRPASDVINAVPATAGVSGASYALDASA